ncbi:MAG: PAS domain-containing protein [Desulfomonile tiedjei]|uniref:PAS domain-containing protein n=1 Tax=Desulfomonile tiedjei TaxID=2358 RepID=A0A9D6V4R0_9BACT|nr:PAS domain-containing protein [Desulfomonile tiedjei]
MKETDLPSFDSPEEIQAPPTTPPTLSIDLITLFTSDVYSSGTFDLSAISSSSIGRLLDALPIPVLLIDQWFQVGFANRSCAKISTDYRKIRGVPFANLVPLPNDVDRAQTLTQKIQALIERAFETRRPQISEAILEIENNRIWARLHLRSVRIGLERHVLLIIEDLTHEKKQIILTQRNDEKYRKANCELGRRLDELTEEVRRLSEHLELETTKHMQTTESLSKQSGMFDELWNRMPAGLAVIGNNGSVKRVNPKFREMFGYDVSDLEGNREWISGWSVPGAEPFPDSVSDWADVFELTDERDSIQGSLQVVSKYGGSNTVNLTVLKAPDQELLMIFDAIGESRDQNV